MIIRGGGAAGAAGRAGGAFIWVTLLGARLDATGGAGASVVVAPPACGAEGAIRGGTAMAGETGFADAAGAVAAGGVTGALGGITTTDGGR